MDLTTDFHSHLIPNVDDGSRGAVETIAMARGLLAMGVRRIHLTPHQFRFGNAFKYRELTERAGEVRTLLARAAIDIEVIAGAEYFYGERFMRAIESSEELMTFEHGGERCVLVELSLQRPSAGVRRVGDVLLRRDVRPVMAHPERYSRLSAARLADWRSSGWLLQLDLPSLAGVHGEAVRAASADLVRRGAYDLSGSDLHRPSQLEDVRRGRDALLDLARAEVVT
jgi:tyrosine-protein phosphatase YwqE